MDDQEERLAGLEAVVATLTAHQAAILAILQIVVLRLDDTTFGEVIELLDFPLPPGMGESATREGDHFFSEFSEHLLNLRKKLKAGSAR